MPKLWTIHGYVKTAGDDGIPHAKWENAKPHTKDEKDLSMSKLQSDYS